MPTISLNTLILVASAESGSVSVLPRVQASTLILTGTAENSYPKVNILADADVALMRSENHEVRLWANALIPRMLWSAQVNDVDAGRTTIDIVFNNGSGTDWALISGGMALWVGTSPGARDIAELRLNGLPTSGDGGITGTAHVRYHSWIISNDQWISFMFDYPIIQKFPYIDPDDNYVFKKDRTEVYVDENSKPLPVTICGTDRAGWLTGGSILFEVDASDSYPMADGATIASYSLSVLPSTGSTKVFNTATGIGTVTFTQTGQWWLAFTSTDSNGKSQTSWRCYWVNDPDPSGTDRPLFEFSNLRLNGDWERGGWTTSFSAHASSTLADIPDKTRILIWGENKYGATEKSITLLPFGDV